jgi:hypothetical protein
MRLEQELAAFKAEFSRTRLLIERHSTKPSSRSCGRADGTATRANVSLRASYCGAF